MEEGQLKERITEKIFHPLLENNKTESQEEEEEELKEAEYKHRHIDGAKLPPARQAQIRKMLNTKYVFSGFNILLYA